MMTRTGMAAALTPYKYFRQRAGMLCMFSPIKKATPI
jgi:hypothetical protein